MWICIFGYVEMHFWLCKDTGTMNRSPTPDGMFCNQFRGGRGELAECFATNFVVDVGNWGVFRNQFRGC